MPGSWMDNYEPVEARLAEFWAKHPNGRVWTELKLQGQSPGELVVVWCAVYKDMVDQFPAATGIAHERILGAPPAGKYGKPNESAPEWTSPYEVCETSAIGRALANLGYAGSGKRPSKEEVEKTQNANELFDVTEWIDPLDENARKMLLEWWKKTEGLSNYKAAAVPGQWLNLIQDQITFLKESVDAG